MSYSIWKYGLWIRYKRRWFCLAYNPGYEPIFSERYGYTKVYRFAGFVFKTKKDKV